MMQQQQTIPLEARGQSTYSKAMVLESDRHTEPQDVNKVENFSTGEPNAISRCSRRKFIIIQVQPLLVYQGRHVDGVVKRHLGGTSGHQLKKESSKSLQGLFYWIQKSHGKREHRSVNYKVVSTEKQGQSFVAKMEFLIVVTYFCLL
ncbi:uncharacterized protein [Macrobrachium rosenbergii]|uniref:uncharacterized protein n=1 Tax=Macrobrachium rosenbergii TaxID=79674 RepID=UPI0034D3A680